MVLIVVVLIGIVVLFKKKLTTLVSDIFTVNNLQKEKKNVILGFRAEDVEIADEGIGAKVETVEILGREKLLTLNHNDRKFKVLVENTFSIEEGKGIYIKPKVGKCYIFDEKTEEFIKKC